MTCLLAMPLDSEYSAVELCGEVGYDGTRVVRVELKTDGSHTVDGMAVTRAYRCWIPK